MEPPATGKAVQVPQIMLVEDERIVAMHLRQQLLKLGYHVPTIAASGIRALRHIETARPDLVLMDIKLEGEMDGIATAAAIPPDYHIPVIYLTAYSEEATLARARATRPYGYLIKPFSERELHATIQMTLERRSAEVTLRATEDRLRQAQKMEAIGQLAGGVAHDFNNLLSIIYGNLDELHEYAGKNPIISGMIDEIYEAARRGATLTQQLLAYSRRQALTPRVVAIGEQITNLTGLLRRTLGEGVQIKLTLRSDLWRTRIDPQQLEIALINLAVNARDAMPKSGSLTIEASNAVLEPGQAIDHTETEPGAYVVLAVSDTGCGMARSVIDRAFEPFFTTKPPGRGTGLGLSMVYGFVKQSAGYIGISSEPGKGTTIRIYLRAVFEEAEPADANTEAAAVSLPRAKAGEVVLVVEDDEVVRRMLVRTLLGLDYHALEAGNGRLALVLLETAARVDLLLTDIVLPGGMSGADLGRRAVARRPELRTVYMSGYPADAIADGGVVVDGVPLLCKPFQKDDIARTLRRVLDR
jgi:signal transduction histidine kinase